MRISRLTIAIVAALWMSVAAVMAGCSGYGGGGPSYTAPMPAPSPMHSPK